MGDMAKVSIANSTNANTCSFDCSRELSITAIKMAAFSEIVPLKLECNKKLPTTMSKENFSLKFDIEQTIKGTAYHPMPELM
ncbi:hypothetical protein CCR75_000098 [Bremia lactucae]|uniref:Uncharacterized protein n=1 Tax=Bremia lactucae TaxID=4779 RepID=A0A976FIG9_BRELC|nr:hypothetical protein CCR75_000098 [Bremia lactucae]